MVQPLEMWKCHWRLLLPLTGLFLIMLPITSQDRVFDMDRLATCGQDITVFENEVVLNGRSNAAPANPPLECTVYLKSGYTEADGRYRLQIIIEAIDIKDCQVHVDVFNGRGAFGSYLRSLGCNSMSTDTLYTENRLATVRFTRPSILYQTAYTFTFKIRTYRDIDGGGYDNTTIRLSPGAIIGIIVGIVALFVVAVLILWCYRTGRIGGFYSGGYGEDHCPVEKSVTVDEINDGLNLAKSESLGSAIDYRDPGVWSSVTNGIYNPEQPMKLGRNFQKRSDNKFRHEEFIPTDDGNRKSSNESGRGMDSAYDDTYEPYESGNNIQLNMIKKRNVAEWNKHIEISQENEKLDEKGSFNRSYGTRGSRGSKGTGDSPNTKRASLAVRGEDEAGQANQSCNDTFTKDLSVGSILKFSDRRSECEKETYPAKSDIIHESSKGRNPVLALNPPYESQIEKTKDSKNFSDDELSENRNTKAEQLDSKRECETKTDKNSDPKKINCISSLSSPGRRKKKVVDGKVDIGLVPEANDPIFTVPVSETPYDPSASLPYTAYGVPNYDVMYPYGMTPVGAYAPIPGQTYAYYQMGPMPGRPPTSMNTDQRPVFTGQAAWYVQDTPQGPVQKAFMVTAESSNRNQSGGKLPQEKSYDQPGTPGYSSTPANFLKPKQGRMKPTNGDPLDISVIATGGPPPEPEAGHRSSVMRKGVDQNTGMHVNQIVWRDTIVDPTDPPADANPQITRKTLTRITTHSGHGDLPVDQKPVAYNDYADRLGIENENPEFLSPRQPVATPALTHTPNRDNQAFYLGRHLDLDRQSYQPDPVIHNATSKNTVFRDRINMEHS